MTRQMIVGKEALTVIRHTNGTRSNVARGRGVPRSADPKDVKRLLDEGFLEVIELLDEVTDDEVAEDDFPSDRFPDLARPEGWATMTDGEKFAYVYGGAPDPSPDGDGDGDGDGEDEEKVSDEEIAELLKGSASDVMGEVGEDVVLAQRVLDAETVGGTVEGRKGLTADLRAVIAEGGES